MKTQKFMVAALIVPLLLLAACSSGGSNGVSTDPILIGTINSMTGAGAAYGEAASRGSDLAAKEINARDGKCYNGAPVELKHEDGKGTAQDAITAAQKLITRDKVNAIVGGASSTEALATATVTKDQVINVNTLAQSDQITADGGALTFQINNTSTQMGALFNKYITGQMGIESLVYMGQDSEFNTGNLEVLKAALAGTGVTLLDTAVYQTDTKDFTPILNKLKQANADAIYVSSPDATSTSAIMPQLRQVGGFNKVIFAPGTISPAVISAAGPSLNGANGGDIYTPTIDTAANKKFVAAYQAAYPGQLPGRPELVNYEGIYVVCNAMTAAKSSTDQQAIAKAIEGLTLESPRGTITWNDKHWPISQSFFIVQVDNGQAKVIDQVKS